MTHSNHSNHSRPLHFPNALRVGVTLGAAFLMALPLSCAQNASVETAPTSASVAANAPTDTALSGPPAPLTNAVATPPQTPTEAAASPATPQIPTRASSDPSAPSASESVAPVAMVASGEVAPTSAEMANAPKAIRWRTDFKKALVDAKKRHKVILADFYTDWCGYCKKLDAEVYTEKPVRALSSRFITVKLNPEEDPTAAYVAEQMRLDGFPSIVFFTVDPDGKGKAIHGINGFCPAPRFVAEMRQALLLAKR